MSAATKIVLSEKELSLVTNADWILTKQKIIGKVYELLAQTIPQIKLELLNAKISFPEEVLVSQPKIYKGENYLQLPYVMLDYPRCFDKENIFALRTMFWWANFFSITLHVSGKYLLAVRTAIKKNEELISDEIYFGVNQDQWEHHFEPTNYIQYPKLDTELRQRLFEQDDFIKIAWKYDLGQWNNMPSLLQEGYRKMAALIS